MPDWLFLDMGFLFFATWTVILAVISYAAFAHDLHPSKAVAPTDVVPRATSRNSGL